jgi:hypothetical protein
VAGDDVRRPRPPRDPLEGRVPRGGRAQAVVFTLSDRPDEVYELVVVVLSDLGDGRTDAVPAAWAHVGQAVQMRRGRVVVLLRPHGGTPGRRLTPRVHLPIVCWIWMVRGEGNETKER